IIVNNSPVNTIDAPVRDGLNQAVNAIEAESGLQAVILLCEGKTCFSGADIGEFNGPPKEEEYRHLFLRFENLNIPVITGMYGTVMGGGLELALACHYRIALEATRFALPEVTLGIIPGAGGTQRMPRCIGIEKTLEMVVNASMVGADEGTALGFIDEVCQGDLAGFTQSYALAMVERKGSARPTSAHAVSPVAADVIEKFKDVARKKYPHQTAAQTAIEA